MGIGHFLLFWWGRCRVLGLWAWLAALAWLFWLCGVVWLVGCYLYSGASICDASFFVLVLVFVLLVEPCLVCCFFGRSVDALVPGADERRGGLRYSSGSRRAGFDPRVPEWGNPAGFVASHRILN